MNSEFKQRVEKYFSKNADKFLEELNKPCSQGFFLNTNKSSKEDIFSIIDFPYSDSNLTSTSFYHNCENIGKTKAYELGLIYPQEIAASIGVSKLNVEGIKTVVDMCAAPGGKTINILNRLSKDALCVCNDVNHTRANILSSNLERLGLDNTIVTCKDCKQLASQLENFADLVILDAPCSGEGMIRKYPEILDDYSIENINALALTQKELLEYAYKILRPNGQLIYSTCTYAFEEDENQVTSFLSNHNDMHLIDLNNEYYSTLKGTIKLCPLNNTEGQFISIMKKDCYSMNWENKIKYLKPVKNKLVQEFISNNLNIDNYYLYKQNEHFYISFNELPNLKYDVLRYSIYIGDIKKDRFEPSHFLYRANSLIGHYKNVYELNDNEYDIYVSGNELKINKDNGYYLLTYKNNSIGYGKCSNSQLKNKYPKGLRKV